MRTTATIVTFTKPFSLPGFEAPHAAGNFEVRTDEERLDTTWEAWRRLETTILLTGRGQTMAWPVSPLDLDKALRLDAQATLPPGPSNGY